MRKKDFLKGKREKSSPSDVSKENLKGCVFP